MMCIHVKCYTLLTLKQLKFSPGGGRWSLPCISVSAWAPVEESSCSGSNGDEGLVGVSSWLSAVFGNALITMSTIVGISSFVSEWLVFVEVSQAPDGGAVDGGSLCGLFGVLHLCRGSLILYRLFQPAEPRRVGLPLTVADCSQCYTPRPDLF